MIIFIDILFLSVGNHVDAVEAARFKRNRGLTKVKKASRMLADSMAEVSMYAKPFSAANWAAVDSSISLRSKRSALLPKIPKKLKDPDSIFIGDLTYQKLWQIGAGEFIDLGQPLLQIGKGLFVAHIVD